MNPFGVDSFDIAQRLKTLVAEDDPLHKTAFFYGLAEDLVRVRDANDFDAAYENAMAALPKSISGDMPPGLDRKILLTLCSDPDYLEAWMRENTDFVVMSRLGFAAVVRYIFWNPLLWPLDLAFYVWLAISFGGAILSTVYGVDLSIQAIQIGKVIGLACLVIEVAVLCGMVTAAIAYIAFASFGATAQITQSIRGWGRARRIAKFWQREAQHETPQGERAA